MLASSLNLILASKSPRRSELLSKARIPFQIKTREVEETYPDSLEAAEVAPYLARKKAAAVKDFIQQPNDVILTADSVVILDGRIYGKPKDREDAIAIIKQLSGRKHRVITGCCLTYQGGEVVFSGISDVYFSSISEEEIIYYVDQYQPYDKAGAYAIQEWIGLCKIQKIEGTFPNIMGLPVNLVYQNLLEICSKLALE